MYWINKVFQNEIVSRLRRQLIFAFLLISIGSSMLFAEDSVLKMVVFYPEIREPYLKIFTDIMDGVEHDFAGEVIRYPLTDDYDVAIVESQLMASNPNVVVTLGRRSYAAIQSVNAHFPVVTGAIATINNDNMAGISLTPSAAIVFEKLKLMAPKVNTVKLVYSPRKKSEFVSHAQQVAAQQGINLVTYGAESLRESALLYRGLLADANSGDAIWLMSDRRLLDNSLLTEILDVAWRKKLIIFSSSPVHVKRGALLAIYPDNYALGMSLGQLASDVVHQHEGARNLEDVLLAVNKRTSDHLGLMLSREVREKVELLLPSN